MDTPTRTEQRLIDLEIKASFSEDLLDQLNQVIVQQADEIAMLVREVALLKSQAPDWGAGAATGARNLRDELPPHY